MAVTKQTYTALANWTTAEYADLLKDAFIDAGYMTDWHDSFTISGSDIVRVLKIEHDSTKTYGTCFYVFGFFTNGRLRVTLANGWDTVDRVPTGTLYLDHYYRPISDNDVNGRQIHNSSTTSNLFIDRYTSGDDAKQTWFVVRQGTNISPPFSILHKDTVLQPWLDLGKGMISGYSEALAGVASRSGFTAFQLMLNLQRCLLTGAIVRGADFNNWPRFVLARYNSYVYAGSGSVSNAPPSNENSNMSSGTVAGGLYLPVGKNSVNPAFLTDYIPICTDLPWSPWTPTRLANDFAVYMHYASNTIAHGNKFIVQAGINEWETLAFANNAVINDGASATFLARVV